MDREIVVAKGRRFRFSVRITLSVVQRDLDAFVCEGLQVRGKRGSNHANVLRRRHVEDRSAQRTVDRYRRAGLSHDDGVIGDEGRIGNNSRGIVPDIAGGSGVILVLRRGSESANEKKRRNE